MLAAFWWRATRGTGSVMCRLPAGRSSTRRRTATNATTRSQLIGERRSELGLGVDGTGPVSLLVRVR